MQKVKLKPRGKPFEKGHGNLFPKDYTSWNKGKSIAGYRKIGWKIKDTSRMNLDKIGKKLTENQINSLKARKGDKNPNWKLNPKYPCEICGSMDIISYDHDHATGLFRGWICRRCNMTLGLVKDNSEMLMRMIKYLNKSKEC